MFFSDKTNIAMCTIIATVEIKTQWFHWLEAEP